MIEMTQRTLWAGEIPSDMLAETRERVERVSKRAIAKGFPVPTLTVGSTETRPTGPAEPIQQYREYSQIAITAFGPLAIGDWTLIGVVDVLANGKPFVRRTPGAIGEPPVSFMLDPKRCDHCHASRERLETFLLTDGAEWKIVGRDCLRDFLGHNPNALIAYARDLDTLTEHTSDGGSGIRPTYAMATVIELAARVLSNSGGKYVSKSNADLWNKPSTRDGVDRLIFGSQRTREEAELDFPESETADRIAANTILALDELAENLPDRPSEWEQALVDLWDAQYVAARQIGYAVSAVILGLRREERKAAAAAPATSVLLGTVGERLKNLTATVAFAREFEGEWGTRTMLKMRSGESDLLWWATGMPGASVGDTVTITATVKAHETDKITGRPITVLTRGSLGFVTKGATA